MRILMVRLHRVKKLKSSASFHFQFTYLIASQEEVIRVAGSECFVQRGIVSVWRAGLTTQYPMVISPTAIPNTSAKTMMKSLVFKTLVSETVVATAGFRLCCYASCVLPCLVILLLLCTDEAASNTRLTRYLAKDLPLNNYGC